MYNKSEKNQIIPSVNFHLWEACNMRCKFCFATFQDVKQSVLPKGHLPKNEAIKVVEQLAELGFQKITFAGGEPTLCPWLSDLIQTAKNAGMTTMIVTNGSKLTDKFLLENKTYLDWIAISIDSLNDTANLSIGRALSGKKTMSENDYLSIIEKVKSHGYGLKINTVVNSKNFKENMVDFMQKANPKRWKVLQVLPIKEQNDKNIDEFIVSKNEFNYFVENHKTVTNIVIENNEDMKGSYAMVDPAGRFFENTKGIHKYSKSIIEVGCKNAMNEMEYDFSKFIKRGGIYDWELNKNDVPKRITISGEVASGKSRIGKLLAEKLNYTFTSIGNKTRNVAESQNISIAEFQKKCLKNPSLDKEIDKEFSNECNTSDNLIIDYRMGFHFIKNSLNIYLRISENEAIKRLKNANRKNETYHTLQERNKTFKQQFLNSYNIDYTNKTNYDLLINVENKSPNEIVNEILSKSREFNK